MTGKRKRPETALRRGAALLCALLIALSAPLSAVNTTAAEESTAAEVAEAAAENVQAVPDSAVFRVTPVTSRSRDYNYDAYMYALKRDRGG